jgi:cytochrome c-type biogenesis protein CcmF
MCFIIDPFEKASLIPADGLGLNEALKDSWMIVHPPLVFISYSAMAFLFSLSATLSENISKDVTDRILLWLRISWLFLGAGILSGSIWAYRALGWGGYWAWDPIENAAFVPWLVICAYLHAREYHKASVCIVPFSIACIGVFLARSGVLKDQSVHAYADGNIIVTGIIFFIILGAVLFLSFTKFRKQEDKSIKNSFSIHFQYYKALYSLLLLPCL